MPNTYANKVQVTRGGQTETLIDLTADTAIASDVAQGKYFHLATGERVVGTAAGGGGSVTQDEQGYIVLPDTGGGGGGESWNWMGKNPTKLLTLPSEHSSFSDLGVGNWTWVTTQSTLRSQGEYSGSSMTLDTEHYSYLHVMRCYVHYDYGNWSPLSAVTDYAAASVSVVRHYFNSYTDYSTDVPSRSTAGTISSPYVFYYVTSNGLPNYSTQSYGIYTTSASNPSMTNMTTLTPTATWRTPVIYIRGSATYFSSEAFSYLDLDESYYDLEGEIWRVDANTDPTSAIENMAINALNNGV